MDRSRALSSVGEGWGVVVRLRERRRQSRDRKRDAKEARQFSKFMAGHHSHWWSAALWDMFKGDQATAIAPAVTKEKGEP